MKKLLLITLLSCCFFANAQSKNVFDVARSGTLAEIEAMYKATPDVIDTINESKSSPLILACYKGNIPVAKFLITNVKNINYSSDMGTALMAATYKNQAELVKLLLEYKANPNATDGSGTTALLLATQFKNIPLVQLLLDYKADKTIKDSKGKTAFEYAAFSGNESLINLLK